MTGYPPDTVWCLCCRQLAFSGQPSFVVFVTHSGNVMVNDDHHLLHSCPSIDAADARYALAAAVTRL